jgi:excisionase family DNA binding protein
MAILTTKQVAELLGVHLNKVYSAIKKDGLPYIRLGRRYKFIGEAVIRWKAEEPQREAERKAVREARGIMSVSQTALMLGVSSSKVYKLCKEQGLPHRKKAVGKRNRYDFHRDAITDWLFSQQKSNPLVA